MIGANKAQPGETFRSARKPVQRAALVVHDEGRVIIPCTMTNASRSGLGLRVPSQVALPNDLLIIDLTGNVVFEARVARRSEETCGVRFQSVHPIAALPPRLQYIATIRRPTSP